MPIQLSQHIAAPIDEVFALVEDERKWPAWMQGLEETTFPEGRDRERPLGARFRQRLREGGRVAVYLGEITAYDKPRHLGLRVGDTWFSVELDYHLRPEGAGTTLDCAAQFTYHHWLARVIGLCFGWLSRRILARQIAKLKQVAEQPRNPV